MISIIIPVYNCEKYIERCVNSVTAQSFSDFELIIINDGSCDNSGNICDGLAKKDSRIKVYHKANGGVSSARNLGIDNADGDYLTFIDGDDTVPPNYLQELFDTVRDSDVSVCDISCVRDNKEFSRFTYNKKGLSKTEAIELLLSRKSINSGPCGKLFKRNVVGNVRFPAMKAYEDMLFVLEVFDNADSISCTDKTEYVYDNGTGGAMSGYAKCPTTDVVTMSEKVLEYLDKHPKTFSHVPEYVTLSHVMQHLQGVSESTPPTEEQKALKSAVIKHFADNKKRIRKNPCFSFKEKLIYLFASHGRWLKKGLKRI